LTEKLKGRDILQDLDEYGRGGGILECNLGKKSVKVRTAVHLIRRGISGGFLWTGKWNFEWGIFWL